MNEAFKAVFYISLFCLGLFISYMAFAQHLDYNDTRGLYFYINGWLAIKIVNETPYNIKTTIHHEIAHYIWDNCMSKKEKENYLYFYNLEECKFNLKHYPKYKWFSEDFAYSYESFMMSYGLCKEKTKYFHNLSKEKIVCG